MYSPIGQIKMFLCETTGEEYLDALCDGRRKGFEVLATATAACVTDNLPCLSSLHLLMGKNVYGDCVRISERYLGPKFSAKILILKPGPLAHFFFYK